MPAHVWCLLLILALLAPPGVGHLDLCLCQGDEHGLFCEGPPPTPQPEARGCCQAPKTPEADAGHEQGCPDCPALELDQDLLLSLPEAEDPAPLHLTASPLTPAAPPTHLPAPAVRGPVGWARPPPPARLHLLHSVFRL